MPKAYQHNASGYYVGEIAEDYGLLPNNATRTAPELQEGFVPRWTGADWEQVEDHRGKQGYVDGKPYTVKDYGPLPAGWSDTPPPPTLEEARTAKIAEIDAGYATVLAWLRAGYPPDEAQTWTMQAEQARQLATDPQAEALFVRALAATKGVSVEEMTGRILVNAQNWEPIAAILTAQGQLMREAAEKAQSVEEVEAIKVSYSV